jgi:polysaccharide export outer membrane protein
MKTFVLTLIAVIFATVAVAQDGYRVRPGDTLAIEVLEDPQLNRSVLVTPGGTISFPFAGTVSATGRTTDQIASAIAGAIAPNFATSPNVFVSVQSVAPSTGGTTSAAATINIYILGEVNTPGTREIERGTTFLQALAQSGGFTRFAATKRIQLRRYNPQTGQSTAAVFNFRALSQGEPFRDFPLADGDIILVPERRLFE